MSVKVKQFWCTETKLHAPAHFCAGVNSSTDWIDMTFVFAHTQIDKKSNTIGTWTVLARRKKNIKIPYTVLKKLPNAN